MTERARSIAAALLIAALALPRVSMAAPPASEPAPAAAEPTPTSEAGVRAALADGDPTSAREQAIALREAEPTLAHFELEADVHEALGDYASAKRALRGALERVGDDAAKREALRTRLEQLDERSRGAVADEPSSSHREQFDAERADRLAALRPAPPKPEPVDVAPPPRVPIVKKWYFWVTLGTIVGAAVAITAVAIDANVDAGDAASRGPAGGPPSSAGGLTLRF